jgi:hypothetical protein
MTDLETQILAREWFYEFKLPSGAVTRTKIQADVLQIHKTRLHMMCQAIEPFFGEQIGEATAIDVASHEGYFSYHLAHRCAKVRGLEVNPANVAAAELIRAVFDLANLQFIQIDINELDAAATEPADLVVAFGVVYHLENPIGILRKLRSLTRRLLLIETQTTMLDLGGTIDWGHHLWQMPLRGIFGVVEGSPGVCEGGTTDIELVPSRNGLIWILGRLGFTRVEIVEPPADAYHQLKTGRRIMLAAYP